jgi:hypothetical protein
MNTKRIVAIAVSAMMGSACAPIQHEQVLTQGPRSGIAGPGDLVARVDKERNLQNAFGASDIFGRKTKEGFTELRFAGVDSQGRAVLFRTDTSIETNETTMSRSPLSTTYANATVSGTSVSVASTTINPASDYHAVIPMGSLQIVVPNGTNSIPFEGHAVQLLAVTPTSLSFRVD